MPIDEASLAVIRECAERKTAVFFSADSLEIVFQTFVIALQNEAMTLANTVTPRFISNVVAADKFFVQCQMIRFVSEEIRSDGQNIVFPLEGLKVIEETRQSQRYPFDADERVVLELVNPFDGQTTLSKLVMDMSSSGLSIKTPFDSQLFQPGTLFRDMKVLIDGELYNRIHGRVVYRRKFLGLDGKPYCQVGFQFEQ